MGNYLYGGTKPKPPTSKLDIQHRLRVMGYEQTDIERAFRVYENNYGDEYKAIIIDEIIARLKIKDSIKQISTETAESTYNKNNIISITVHVVNDGINGKYNIFSNTEEWLLGDNDTFDCVFNVNIIYSNKETIGNIINTINEYLRKKYDPILLKVNSIDANKSFINTHIMMNEDLCDESLLNEKVTEYNKSDIINKGLFVEVKIEYLHQPKSTNITCHYMRSKNTEDPMICPIYSEMMSNNQCDEHNLNHLEQFIHIKDEYIQKPECTEKQKCTAYERMDGSNNELQQDRCHMLLYRHPPRGRSIELSQNIASLLRMHEEKKINYNELDDDGDDEDVNALVFNKSETQNHNLYEPTDDDIKEYSYNETDGFVYGLIEEVIQNGYEDELGFIDDEMENNEMKESNVSRLRHVSRPSAKVLCSNESIYSKYSILKAVDDKIQCHRHKLMGSPLNRGEMLALMLYTGCQCNYDLCKSQRDGDYLKWKWFDYCLFLAIDRLSFIECGSFSVFTGLNKVRLKSKCVECGYFVTYLSTSWNRNIAKQFANDDGMIIEMDKSFKNNIFVNCCDVSWISRFPDECEILFARSMNWTGDGFKCVVLNDDINDIQTVLLSKNSQQKEILNECAI